MRRAFARVGAGRRLVASRLFQLAKINGRLKELRPLSQSRLLSGPNNASFLLVALSVSVSFCSGTRPRVRASSSELFTASISACHSLSYRTQEGDKQMRLCPVLAPPSPLHRNGAGPLQEFLALTGGGKLGTASPSTTLAFAAASRLAIISLMISMPHSISSVLIALTPPECSNFISRGTSKAHIFM